MLAITRTDLFLKIRLSAYKAKNPIKINNGLLSFVFGLVAAVSLLKLETLVDRTNFLIPAN